MANHGKNTRTGERLEAHRTKPSRASRFGRRWDARVKEMRDELDVRAKAAALAEAD